eukprot:CAMPEP_0168354936 /NCGR_PEP_ID=MMETSP0213-20121227/24215_1 /TAXON_ID=151035 /ORGANISM="Euplotes harpa, Strain FSP1.4" /LENGTH=147 /DNA_ID=CAMNT_0008366977 /DNA_START=185 /DNA_END=628 /DNA_ORIENTATION=+
MISGELVEHDPAFLIQLLQTDQVLLVESGVLERSDRPVSLQLVEPRGLSRIDHRVLREHSEEDLVQPGEPVVCVLVECVFVVQSGQEDRVLLVVADVIRISEISSRPDVVLHQAPVDSEVDDVIDCVTNDSVEAMWELANSSLRGSE